MCLISSLIHFKRKSHNSQNDLNEPSHAASLHIEYPMLFRVESLASGRSTHCGVLEFVAEEGVIYMPHWVSHDWWELGVPHIN